MRTDYPYIPGWRLNKENNKPAIKHSVLMLTTHGVVEGEWFGDKWIQYRWNAEVKDSDVLYWMHLCDLEALEKEGDEESLEKEQPQESNDIEESISNSVKELGGVHKLEDGVVWYRGRENNIKELAKYFYELGLNTRDNATKIKGWVARDKDGCLYCYTSRPWRLDCDWRGNGAIFLKNKENFPDLKWEDEPIEVELIVRKI